MELENNNELGLMVQRYNERIGLGIHHKTTSTQRFITSSSFHPIQHKKTAFYSMVFCLLNIPLTEENYEKEKSYIYEVARINGYSSTMVDQLIHRFQTRHNRRQLTLTPAEDSTRKSCIVLPYSSATLKISNTLSKIGYVTTFSGGQNLQKILGGTKDKIPLIQQAGIYKLNCPVCDASYVEQIRRQFKFILQEHQNESQKRGRYLYHNAIAEHMNENHHRFEVRNIKSIEHKLDAWESYFISKETKTINRDEGPLTSYLFNIIDN